MLYVYRRSASNGARDLAEGITLTGVLARRTRGQRLQNLQRGDRVVCWGDHFVAPEGVLTLNNVAPVSKFEEAQKLTIARVATVQVSKIKPAVRAIAPPRAPFEENRYNAVAGRYNAVEIAGIMGRMQQFLQDEQRRRAEYDRQPVPAPVAAEVWLPRKNRHVGGNDLLNENLENPDFYSKKENIVEEYRLHMFNGRSIRAGKKIQRPTRPDGRTPSHQWIRSFDAGWIIQYENFNSTREQRALAASAVKALGLDFAAVDIAKRADGSLIVLEVNRAPGVEGNTITAYATKIAGWARGEQQEEDR